MNSIRHTSIGIATALNLIAFPFAWCVGQDSSLQAPKAPSNLTLLASEESISIRPSLSTSAIPSDASIAEWTDIKDNPYERRALFFIGLERLQARVDQQIGELAAKRASMDGITETGDWDFAMKEMANARSYLMSMDEEARSADVESWSQVKEKVGYAWMRTQDAYSKVKASTTS